MTWLLLEWVVTASLLILAVLALRALLGKRISAGLKYALWAVVLVRLLVPLQLFTLPVPAVVPELDREPALPAVSAAPAATLPVIQGEPVGVPAIAVPVPSGVATNYNTPMEPETVTPDVVQIGTVLGWLWLAGALVMTATFLISNLTFALRLRRVRTPLEGADCPLPVYVADGLPSPCLFGLFRPAVYVPEETAQDPAMLRHILAHEYTHFRHGDHIWNVLRSAALALHWWNPLVWLAVILSRRDGELACDEGALKRLGDRERIAYGRTLLALITARTRPGDLFRCATTMTGGQKSVFDRVSRIAHAPKRWLWAAVAAVIVTALACVCAFGQAEEQKPWDPSSITADLAFSLEAGSDGNTYVRMDGTVDGVELTRGAFWNPDWWHGDYCEAELTLAYPPFTDGIEGHIEANWEGGSGSEVTISTRPTALPSSYMPSGWWVFTVDLDRGEVTCMESPTFEGAAAGKEGRMYPTSISDEEAVRAARVAAKLLTAGKDYYKSQCDPFYESFYSDVLQNRQFYSVDNEKWTTLDDLLKEEKESGHMAPGFEVSRYTLVDLSGDGRDELVLWIAQEGVGETYLIFHQLDGRLYGYFGLYKSMQEIKADGTFYDRYLYSTEWDRQSVGYSRVSFTETGMEFHPFTYSVSLPGDLPEDEKYVYVVDGKTVDYEIYFAAVEAQEAKPRPVWHEFRHPVPVDLYAALPELYAEVMRGESKFVLYKNEPPISIDEVPAIIDPYDAYMCIQRYTVVDLLGGKGSNKMPQVLAYVGGVAGDMAGYLLLWDEDGQVHGEIFDSNGWRNRWFIDLKTDGTFMCTDPLGGHDWMSISQLRPTAAGSWSLYSDAVWRGLDSSGKKIGLESFMVIGQELDKAGFEQAMETHCAKPDVTWYVLPLKDLDAIAQSAAPVIDPGVLDGLDGLTFSDGWHNSVNVEGVDVQEMYWYSPEEQHYPYGRMFFTNPAFLGAAFEGKQVNGYAQWTDGGHTAIEIDWSWDSLPYLDFSVDLANETIDCDAVWDGLTDDDLLAAVRTLGALMERAEAYKTSADYRPPMDGPLPFEQPMELMFCSGAGAWQTNLLLYPDGSFEGDFHDADMTIKYICQFHGRFGDIRQVTGSSWSLALEELTLDTKYPVGAEWDEGVIHYISSNPYGFDKKGGDGPLEPGAQFMLYTPEAKGYRPTDELYGMEQSDDYESVMYQFWGWWPDKHVWGPYGDTLDCYALCNMATGYGFFDLNAWGIA